MKQKTTNVQRRPDRRNQGTLSERVGGGGGGGRGRCEKQKKDSSYIVRQTRCGSVGTKGRWSKGKSLNEKKKATAVLSCIDLLSRKRMNIRTKKVRGVTSPAVAELSKVGQRLLGRPHRALPLAQFVGERDEQLAVALALVRGEGEDARQVVFLRRGLKRESVSSKSNGHGEGRGRGRSAAAGHSDGTSSSVAE